MRESLLFQKNIYVRKLISISTMSFEKDQDIKMLMLLNHFFATEDMRRADVCL